MAKVSNNSQSQKTSMDDAMDTAKNMSAQKYSMENITKSLQKAAQAYKQK